MKTFIDSLMLWVFLIPSIMWSQSNVTGTVTDETNEIPLPGVNILIKGTTTGTTSDFDGNYSISAKKDDVIVFSYVGFKPREVNYNGQNEINVALQESASELSEVILIGYGSTSKRYATGSVNQVSTEDFNKGRNTAPEQLLVGKVPGLQITPNSGAPGSGSKITIRGGSSLNAVNEPLFVIDGIPMDNGSEISGSDNPLNYINPNDIESMSVLKDASATAIYGARASNGVVLITTKKGANTKELKVNVAYSTSVSNTTRTVNTLNADQFRDLVNSNSNASEQELLGTENTDWQEEIFQTAVAQDAYISLSGSIKEKLPFRFSVGYTNEDGVLKTGNFERATSSMGITPTFFDDHLSFEANIKGSYEENNFADKGAISAAYRFDPTKPVYSGEERFGGYWEWIDEDDNKANANASANPMGRLKLTDNHSYGNRSVGNLKTDYKFHFLPELKATVNIGYDYSESNAFLSIPSFARKEYNIKKPEDGGINENHKQLNHYGLKCHRFLNLTKVSST